MTRGLLIGLTASLVFGAAAAWAEPATVRIASFLPARSNVNAGVLTPYIKSTEAAFPGLVKFQTYWGGALGRNPTKQYEMLLNGVTDIAFIGPSYTGGVFPDFKLFELPYLAANAYEGSFGETRMYARGLLGGLEKMHVIGLFSSEGYLLHSKKPIARIEDVNGLKIRSAGPVQAAAVKRMGAVPIFMPVTKMVEALDRGVMDGALLSWGGMNSFKVAPILKNHYGVQIGVLPFILGMNKDKWDSLSKDAQAALMKFGGEHLARASADRFDGMHVRVKARHAKEADRRIIEPEGAELERARLLFKPVHDEIVSSLEGGQRKYEALTKIIAELRAGR